MTRVMLVTRPDAASRSCSTARASAAMSGSSSWSNGTRAMPHCRRRRQLAAAGPGIGTHCSEPGEGAPDRHARPWMAGSRSRRCSLAGGADPALPVGGSLMSEPQDAASESIHQEASTPEYMAAAPPTTGRRRFRLAGRVVAGVTALLLIAGLVALGLSRSGPATPDKQLAQVRSFVEKATSTHIEGTMESASDNGRDGLGSSFSSKSRLTADIR